MEYTRAPEKDKFDICQGYGFVYVKCKKCKQSLGLSLIYRHEYYDKLGFDCFIDNFINNHKCK